MSPTQLLLIYMEAGNERNYQTNLEDSNATCTDVLLNKFPITHHEHGESDIKINILILTLDKFGSIEVRK